MKTRLVSSFVAVALLPAMPVMVLAAETSSSSATTAAEKPKPLTGGEKTFVKNSLESMYLLMNLTDKHKRDSIKNEDAKMAAEKINSDLNKLWGEIAPVASDAGMTVPSELTGSDKAKAAKLSKTDADKYDKEFLKLVTKETKALAKQFETASKSAQHPNLKQITTNWTTTVKGHELESEKAEKAVAKAK